MLTGVVCTIAFSTGLYQRGVADAQQSQPFRIASTPLIDTFFTINVADKMGYFSEEGLKVEETTIGAGGPAITAAIIGGSLEGGVASVEQTIRLADRGGAVRLIVATTPGSVFALVVRPEFAARVRQTPPNLRGMRFAVVGFGGGADVALRVMLSDLGYDPGRDVAVIDTSTTAAQVAALANKTVDGAAIATAGAVQLETQGQAVIAVLYRTSKYRSRFVGWTGVEVGLNVVKQRPADIKRFVRALTRASGLIRSRSRDAMAVAQQEYGKALGERGLVRYFELNGDNFGGALTRDKIQQAVNVLVATGELKHRVDPDQVIVDVNKL